MRSSFIFLAIVGTSLLAGCATTEPIQKPQEIPAPATQASVQTHKSAYPFSFIPPAYRSPITSQETACQAITQQLSSYVQYIVQHNEKVARQCVGKSGHAKRQLCWNKLHGELLTEGRNVKSLGEDSICTPQDQVYQKASQYILWSKEVTIACSLTGTRYGLSTLAAQKAMEARRELLAAIGLFG